MIVISCYAGLMAAVKALWQKQSSGISIVNNQTDWSHALNAIRVNNHLYSDTFGIKLGLIMGMNLTISTIYN